MIRYGYAKFDTTARTLIVRIGALRATGCVVTRQVVSASIQEGRTEVNSLLDFISEGDEVAAIPIDSQEGQLGDLSDSVGLLLRPLPD